MPAASFARTRNVCEPATRPVYVTPVSQSVYASPTWPSSWHSKSRLPEAVTLSLPAKLNVAEVAIVAADG